MTNDEYLNKTIALMNRFHIPVRRTYSPTYNYDDFLINGRKHDGPRHFSIEFLETNAWATVTGKPYVFPGEPALAWDGYKILIPERLRRAGRADDVIIHECVHFLQHTTLEEEKAYITFNITDQNWAAYLGQRVELEAHFIQIAYMFTERESYVQSKLNVEDRNFVWDAIGKCMGGQPLSSATDAVFKCKTAALV